eukprot:CAMPEP_0170623286 /NCGR_PEP_ID=MMETSP0224-20130122/29611_1 /TAXON_ID=285029 /ORGANISM="Togula jolla, Strain CCCM 725" /LENGTH=552 /DNA_ID=CAMNT_0010949717 /DNA_START=105 /DNA_END=1763 /DNA_ORIENTATION=-
MHRFSAALRPSLGPKVASLPGDALLLEDTADDSEPEPELHADDGQAVPEMGISAAGCSAESCSHSTKRHDASALHLLLVLAFLLLCRVLLHGAPPSDFASSESLGLESLPEPWTELSLSCASNSSNCFADEVLQLHAEATGELPPLTETITVQLKRQHMPLRAVGDQLFYKSAYYGVISLGTPAVPFTVVFDTGSGHALFPSTYCRSETCRSHKRFRPKDSESAKDIDHDGTVVLPGQPRDSITVSFGTGEVTGVFIEDTLCLGEAPLSDSTMITAGELKDIPDGCVKMRFIAATEMSEDPFKAFKFDGVIGLGLEGLSQTSEFNFMSVLSKTGGSSGLPMANIFSVFLADTTTEVSEIILGGWKAEHLEDPDSLAWNDVLDPELGHWTTRIKSIRVDNVTLNICDDGCKAVADTGTALLAVPTVSFREVYLHLRHSAGSSNDCNGDGPLLHIDLEGITLTLGPRDYSRFEAPKSQTGEQSEGSAPVGQCKPMLMSMDLPKPLGPKLWILGEPVMRRYYAIYDAGKKRIGFGRARHNNDFAMNPYAVPEDSN